jgi:hypothetical protein
MSTLGFTGFEMSQQTLTRVFGLAKTELYGIVAIALVGLELSHYTRTSFEHSNSADLSVSVYQLGHSNFFG